MNGPKRDIDCVIIERKEVEEICGESKSSR